MKLFAVITLGCKLNQVDTEAIRESFVRAGWEETPFKAEADVYVVNTCTVTGETDHQSRQMLRRAVRQKELRPGVRVVATGCYTQVDPDGLAGMVEGIDLLVGNLDKERIPELLKEMETGRQTCHAVRDVFEEKTFRPFDIGSFSDRTRAFLRIQEGCDRRCAYCIVPYARGRERSAAPGFALSQARRLVDAGYKELVLTGIHIGRYGRGPAPETTLARLLLELYGIDGLRRIRLSSIDPGEFSDELFEALDAIRGGLCTHFHISLQSGDDAILRAMRRDYTVDEYVRVVGRLRSLFPDVCIGADVIVGFPGETDSSFETTRRALESFEPAYLHIFRYSQRPGTPAADMTGQVPEEVKKQRSRELHEVRRALNERFQSRFIGESLEVLFESRRCKKTGRLTGLTRNYIRVFADGTDEWQGRIATAEISSLTSGGVVAGEIRRADGDI